MNVSSACFDEGEQKFTLGHIMVTPNAVTRISQDEILLALARHIRGDWGLVNAHDRSANERALRAGERLLSRYQTVQDVTFWIITEADRSLTTVLLPEDY